MLGTQALINALKAAGGALYKSPGAMAARATGQPGEFAQASINAGVDSAAVVKALGIGAGGVLPALGRGFTTMAQDPGGAQTLNMLARALAGPDNAFVNQLTGMTDNAAKAQQYAKVNQQAQDQHSAQLKALVNALGNYQASQVAGDGGKVDPQFLSLLGGAQPQVGAQTPAKSVFGNVNTSPISANMRVSGMGNGEPIGAGLLAPTTRETLGINPFTAGADAAQSQPQFVQPQTPTVNPFADPINQYLTAVGGAGANPFVPALPRDLKMGQLMGLGIDDLQKVIGNQQQEALLRDQRTRDVLNTQERQRNFEMQQAAKEDAARQALLAQLQKMQEHEDALNKPVTLSEGSVLVNPQTGEPIASGNPRQSLHPVTLDIDGAPTPGVQVILPDGTSRVFAGGQEVSNPQTYYRPQTGWGSGIPVTLDSIDSIARDIAGGSQTRIRELVSPRDTGAKIALYERIKYYDPNFDIAGLERKIKMESDFTVGKDGQNIQSFDTFLQHASAALDAMEKAELAYSPLLNRPINWLRNNVTGNPKMQALVTSLPPVKKEFESFLLNNRALYESDRKEMDDILTGDKTPRQIIATIRQMAHTAEARLNAANSRYKNVMGEDLINPMSDDANTAMKRFGLKINFRKEQAQPDQTGNVTYWTTDENGIPVKMPNDAEVWEMSTDGTIRSVK